MPRFLGVLPKGFRLLVDQERGMRPLSLRYPDPATESRFQASYIRDNLSFIRFAHVMGIISWALFRLLAQLVLEEGSYVDLLLRFGLAVPSVAASLACTYARWYPAAWKRISAIVLVFNGMVWSTYRALVHEAPPDWGYAGLMIVLAFSYILIRLPFTTASLVGAVTIAYYNVIAIFVVHYPPEILLVADFFLVSFALIGMAAAYWLERSARLLFLRERELDRERERADDILANTLPRAIVERLKETHESPEGSSIAQGLPQVTVLFADLVDFTVHASRIPPSELVVMLDDVFTRFDGLADRFGLEKIKTVGDAYMAVAGAPEPRPDHAELAAEMAFGILETLTDVRWPDGQPMTVRIGVASGPVVAGVIGRRKFAYDLWGDTVNVASRLQGMGEPGHVIVSETTVALLKGRYVFSDPYVVHLKGKGPTSARRLVSRIRRSPRHPSAGAA